MLLWLSYLICIKNIYGILKYSIDNNQEVT
jgi:hypothetical protein